VPVVLGAPERLLEEASWAEVFENLGAEVPWLLGLVVARLVEEAWLMMMQRCTLRNEEVCWPPLRLQWHVALPSWRRGEWLPWRRDDVASNDSSFLEQSPTLEASQWSSTE
jgi:hypothetical protein